MLYMPSHTQNAIKKAIYSAENKYKGHFAVHALDSDDTFWLIRIRVSDLACDYQSPDLVLSHADMTRDKMLAVLEMMAQEYWKVRDKH